MNQHEPGPPLQASAAEAANRVTPMMEQYVEIRAANPDCLLFYRMGDFYELFFHDAEVASRALGITLTKRGKHLGEEIPMCGVPIHAADDYLQKLIALGYRVAVCEQTEDPAEARRRGGKSVVRRAVTRLISPGTITEERLLEPGRSNYLAALAAAPASGGADRHALAWMDISTGEFRIARSELAAIGGLLSRVEPREVLVSDKLAQDAQIRNGIKEIGAALTPLPQSFFDAGTAQERLGRACGVVTTEAFGDFNRAELAAGAALVTYVDKTQVAARPPIEPPRQVTTGESMRLDAATRANLELFKTIAGSRQGSLLAAVDRTRTAAGARLLAERLASPLRDPARIAERLDGVAFFVDRPDQRQAVRKALATAPDILRALSRLALERGGPRDLHCIAGGVEAAVEIARSLDAAEPGDAAAPAFRPGMHFDQVPTHLPVALRAALTDDLPLLKRDGGFVRHGASPALDDARGLRDESRKIVAALQARYAQETGIRGLKIRHNNQLGYYIEVNAAQGPALIAADGFTHRQTMASAMRFSTAELGALDEKIASAAERALGIELEIFDALAAEIAAADEALRRTARTLAQIDVAAGLAELAAAENYVRPLVDASLAFGIEGGRHPVVEQALKAEGVSFVGNDCDLGPIATMANTTPPHPAAARPPSPAPKRDTSRFGTFDGEAGNTRLRAGEGNERGRIWLITGPNMAGKSTFLRQNALIAILAQIGSFVPATRAHLGVVDALFSRVGAADDLARGRSTFMVEMVETAAILNQAGPRALVILDEIGRGTATFDGLSIAWAAIEHLHEENGCRGLFATHYHELTALGSKLPRLHNATIKVKEWKGDVVFLHEIVPGAADRSYGIQVAKLAGLPPRVIARAREVLRSLEKNDRSRPRAMIEDLPLFSVPAAEPAEAPPHPALAALNAIDPDELSPKEALERLYELKRLGTGETA